MSAATARRQDGATENPFAGQGSVLLDIGDDVGALVVTMPAGMEGVEVEIRRDRGRQAHDHAHAHVHHPHVAVVNRPTLAGEVPSLVFPEVQEGDYGIHLKESEKEILTVSVIGGEVTSVDWPR